MMEVIYRDPWRSRAHRLGGGRVYRPAFAAERGTALKITTSQDTGPPHCESPVDEGMYKLGLAAVLQAWRRAPIPR